MPLRNVLSLLIVGLLGLASTGCETETVKGDVRVLTSVDPDTPKVSREDDLKSRVQADPKDSRAWFELGDYYERGMQLGAAAECYERGAALMDDTRYTGGHYTLAKVYMRLQDFPRAFAHLDRLAQLEPKDPKAACLNPHFREGHYLRGAIFYINQQWQPAKKAFVRFLELGGEESRVSEWLDRIESERG